MAGAGGVAAECRRDRSIDGKGKAPPSGARNSLVGLVFFAIRRHWDAGGYCGFRGDFNGSGAIPRSRLEACDHERPE
jgi:hypothetical protein